MKKNYISPKANFETIQTAQIIASSPSTDSTPQLEEESEGGEGLVKDYDNGFGNLW